MRFQVQRSQQEHQLEPICLPKYVERENVTFLILVLTFHHQLAQVNLVEPCQVQDVVLLLWPERAPAAWISCVSWVPTSDFFFPSITRSICLCREVKERAAWQTSDKLVEAHGFCVCDTAQFYRTRKGNASPAQQTEQEKCPL